MGNSLAENNTDNQGSKWSKTGSGSVAVCEKGVTDCACKDAGGTCKPPPGGDKSKGGDQSPIAKGDMESGTDPHTSNIGKSIAGTQGLQAGALTGSAVKDSAAQTQANYAGAEAEKVSRSEKSIYQADQTVRSAISSDYNRAVSTAEPLLESSNPADQQRANQFLAQSLSPPQKYAEVYDKLELHTNRDVLEKGPQYVDNLDKAIPEREKNADFFQDQAQKAYAAADKLDGFTKTLNQRRANLGSIQDNSGITAKTPLASDIKNSASLDTIKSEEVTAGDGALKLTDSKGSAAKGSTIAVTAPDSASKGFERMPASLRDRLRARLAASANNGKAAGADSSATENKDAPKSAFDSLFEAAAKKKDSSGGADANAEHLAGSSRNTRFQMAGSETDAAVQRLMSGLDSETQAANEVFGNPNVTIFARMSKYLKQAQAEKKVAR
ncbi:MAG: hypothetical protein ACXWSC_12865 [Bdellovibrionota bacterium]